MFNKSTKQANDARALKDVSQTFLNNDRHNRNSHAAIGPSTQPARYQQFSQIEAAGGELCDEKDDLFAEGLASLNPSHMNSCQLRGNTLDRQMSRKSLHPHKQGSTFQAQACATTKGGSLYKKGYANQRQKSIRISSQHCTSLNQGMINHGNSTCRNLNHNTSHMNFVQMAPQQASQTSLHNSSIQNFRGHQNQNINPTAQTHFRSLRHTSAVNDGPQTQRNSSTSQGKTTFRQSKITSIVQNTNTDIMGHALISDSMMGGQDQAASKQQPDRSKSSGSLPILNNKKSADQNGQKKAEITSLSQVNDFNGLNNAIMNDFKPRELQSQVIGGNTELSTQGGLLPIISDTDILNNRVLGSLYHPSREMSRKLSNDIQRQNVNVRHELNDDIDQYLRDLEKKSENDVTNCLGRHKITSALRARMIDWMIEVLTNFRCDDQTFFLAVSLQDRYFKFTEQKMEISDLHVVGVTSMFVASKFEDIYPLKMKTVFEKIAHKKLEIEKIKTLELEIMKSINYKIHAPTVLDFLKVYMVNALGIEILNRTETKKKEELALMANNNYVPGKPNEADNSENMQPQEQQPEKDMRTQVEKEAHLQKYLIEKMSIYLAKMSMHEINLSVRNPSLLAVGAIYVALKICEQLKKKELINAQVVTRLINVSKMGEDQILDVSQKVLYLAQNFDKEFPGLENLKKTHFGIITQLL